MSRPLRVSYDLPAGVEVVHAALTDEGWPAQKAAALDDGSRLEEREQLPDGGLRLRATRGLPAGIPGFLAKLLPADGRAGQTEIWEPARPDGSRHGSWQASMPGAPVDLGGTMRLEPTADGCTYTIEGTAKVKLPIVGGKAEQVLVDLTTGVADKETGLLRTLVGG